MARWIVLTSICLVLCHLSAQAATTRHIVVRDINGTRVAPLEGGKRRATVLIFITQDCPIANACAPEIERIYRAYSARQINMFLVYVDPELSAEAARSHHSEYRYSCPAVLDPTHILVRAAHAEVTPEAALFDRSGGLLYHGNIDDRAVAFGQVRAAPTRRFLREALDHFLHGSRISVPHIKAVGCSISDLSNTR